MVIDITYEAQKKLHISYKKIIEDIVSASIDYLSCPYEIEVSVSIVDEETIQSLNSEYRGIDKATDVLSFPANDYFEPAKFDEFEDIDEAFNMETGDFLLGDIILSAEHIIKQADEYGHTRKRELAFLVAHSMLHLVGFDHIDDTEREKMELMQREILETKGYKR